MAESDVRQSVEVEAAAWIGERLSLFDSCVMSGRATAAAGMARAGRITAHDPDRLPHNATTALTRAVIDLF